MVFKRRDKRSFWQAIVDFIYPKGGWKRSFQYMRHRLGRLPDTPHRIARGIFVGILVAFSPLFGIHFLMAVGLAWLIRGNIFAALLATFVANPLTIAFIVTSSLQLGNFMLGRDFSDPVRGNILEKFSAAAGDFKENFVALFTDADAHWGNLYGFYQSLLLPYQLGGLVLGVVFGLMAYYASVPVIETYQKARRKRMKKKQAERREKAAKKADDTP